MPPLAPLIVKPVATHELPDLISVEYFGKTASKQEDVSLSMVQSKAGVRKKPAGLKEHIICTEGAMELTFAGGSCSIDAGQSVLLPHGLAVECKCEGAYTVVSLPAHVEHSDEGAEVSGLTPVVVEKVDVVDAPGITISEHFGKVASNDGACSLARAVVKGASEEAFQAPLFDEFVVCDHGSIEFLYGESERVKIHAGEAVFLPNSLRVKWVWPEATFYTVLCVPAFSPELSGRESDESATVAKDSASMARLEALHAASEQ